MADADMAWTWSSDPQSLLLPWTSGSGGLVVVIKGPRSWTRDDAIRTAFDESPADYHHRLGRILYAQDAAEFAAMLVRRVRRQRARRLARRTGQTP